MNVTKPLRFLLPLICIAGTSIVVVASCLGPTIALNAAGAPAGGSVIVTGRFFTDGCHDVCINGVCPPTYPAKGVKILFIQFGKTQEVGQVDANKDFEISIRVSIPRDATLGNAEFVAETLYENHLLRTRPVPFTVTVSPTR